MEQKGQGSKTHPAPFPSSFFSLQLRKIPWRVAVIQERSWLIALGRVLSIYRVSLGKGEGVGEGVKWLEDEGLKLV